MMDGRFGAIREALDAEGYQRCHHVVHREVRYGIFYQTSYTASAR